MVNDIITDLPIFQYRNRLLHSLFNIPHLGVTGCSNEYSSNYKGAPSEQGRESDIGKSTIENRVCFITFYISAPSHQGRESHIWKSTIENRVCFITFYISDINRGIHLGWLVAGSGRYKWNSG